MNSHTPIIIELQKIHHHLRLCRPFLFSSTQVGFENTTPVLQLVCLEAGNGLQEPSEHPL